MENQGVFRIFIFGKISNQTQPQELITFAECDGSRTLARVQLEKTQMSSLVEDFRTLRSFIESDFPPKEQSSLEEIGSKLFNFFIKDNVRRLMDKASGLYHELLPVEIYAEDHEIASWPWEYLYDPTIHKFICRESHPVFRGIFTLSTSQSFYPIKEKVHLLMLIGILPDDPNTTPEEEVKWIQEVFDSKLATESIDIKVLQAVGPMDLHKELQNNEYDILHFFGHARFDDACKEGYLKLERPNSNPYHFYANHFAELIGNIGKNVRLVFLNACESGRNATDVDPARSAIAASVLERGIPAVIATQFSIPDASAHYLSSMIYNSLLTGRSLIEAMRDGRQAMSYDDQARFFDWGIPILYTGNPNLVVFPLPKEKQPNWIKKFEKDIEGPNVVKNLSVPSVHGGPSIIVERTLKEKNKDKAKIQVALVDLDSKVGFLPDLIEAANQAQSFFLFHVAYIPLPTGVIRTDFSGGDALPQMFLPRLETYLTSKPQELSVKKVCCLTQHLIAGESGRRLYWNHLAAPLRTNKNVSIISTYDVRKFAQRAQVPFAKAVLFMCLGQLIVTDGRWSVGYHSETVGCLFDYCKTQSDIIVGLKKMKFDHDKCREQIKDKNQLDAIDALMRLSINQIDFQ